MASPFDNSRDITLTGDGLQQAVDDRTLFCTPDPLAASTVTRKMNRGLQPPTASYKGSFLDDMSRLSMQSLSAMDLTSQLQHLNLTGAAEHSPRDGIALADSGPDLIQFSGATVGGNDDQETNESDVSTRSSMGLIPSDMLNDCDDLLETLSGTELSASVLPMTTPKADPVPDAGLMAVDSSHSTVKEKTGDSHEWSDNSKQDSKQDSKDLPWGRSQIETVKKRPQSLEGSREAAPQRLVARGAMALFAGHLLDQVQEGEELDQSLVELGDDDLRQLDNGVDFSDLEEDRLSGRESGDEDFDFDEPMLSLPTRGRVDRGPENGREEEQGKSLQAELAEAENRLAEGQESEEPDSGRQQTVAPGFDFALDSRYFRKTPMSFAGDGEDTEVASSRSSLAASVQQRGAAEGEHLLTKLRRQFMTGDGSENEIDTDDELEAARKSLALAARERGQGADEEDSERSNLPLPVGLEDDRSSDSQRRSSNTNNNQKVSQFSSATRQPAEGDAAQSPLPWNGGGDGSSGGDSDGSSRKGPPSVDCPTYRYVSGSAESQDLPANTLVPASAVQPVTAEDESGLSTKFFMPTSSNSFLQDSEVISPQTLEGSTFNVEDMLLSRTEALPSVKKDKQDEESWVEAVGASTEDMAENPFEGQFGGSLGSFGLEPDNEETSAVLDKSTEKANKNFGDSGDRPTTPQLTGSASLSGLPAKDSGSFDGPFRKPRLPAPSKKKLEKKEPFTAASKSNDSWTEVTFAGSNGEGDANLDQELKDLGVDVGDDHFLSAGAARVLLDADEEQFEKDNKFSEHHQLDLAAGGLAWAGEDSEFSGYLGGEDHPAHLETSIGTYMAARTETLGTLGGDPSVARPEFGRPVQSPPHCRYPRKVMSPPSTASSILLDSRTEGEGNEDGDKTMVLGDTTLPANSSPSSSGKSPSLQLPDKERSTPTADCGNTDTAEITMKGELSSLLLDLTNNRSDLTMEDALSISAVLGFINNNSFTESSDLASAILNVAKKKSYQRPGGQQVEDSRHGEGEATVKSMRQKGEGEAPSSQATPRDQKGRGRDSHALSSTQSFHQKASDSTVPSVSPPRRGSKLPIPVGAGSSPKESGGGRNKPAKTDDSGEGRPWKGKDKTTHPAQPYQAEGSVDIKQTIGHSHKEKQGSTRLSSEQVRSDISENVLDQGKEPDSSKLALQHSGDGLSTGEGQRKTQPSHAAATAPTPERFSSLPQSTVERSTHQGQVQQKQRQPSKAVTGRSGERNLSSTVAPDLNKSPQISSEIPSSCQSVPGMKHKKDKSGAVSRQQHVLQTPPQRLHPDNHTLAGASQGHSHKRGNVGMESHPFALVSGGGDSRLREPEDMHRGSPVQAERPEAALQPWPTSPSRSGREIHRPTLLTGTSLLNTEFAQRYLPPVSGGHPTAEMQTPSCFSSGISQQSAVQIPPSLPSSQRHQPPPNVTTTTTTTVSERPHLASSARQMMEESAVSFYHELNEDLQQTTMMAGENTALGSFWGKSPLFQSTPALEAAKVAAVSMTASRLEERDLTASSTSMVTPRIQRQLIEIQRTFDFPEFCCLGVSQKATLPVVNKMAYGVMCRFRLIHLLHNGKAVNGDQQSPFELKPKLSIGAGGCESLPVLFVPKRPGEHVCQVEVVAQSLNPSLETTSSVVLLRAVAEIPRIQIFPSAEVLQAGEVMWGGSAAKTIKIRNMNKASLPVRLSIWSGSSVWHSFTFDSSENSSDMSMISMSSRPESVGRNITTVILPGCDSPEKAKAAEVTVYCRPPKKDLNRTLAERPAEKIEAKIAIEVDTPVQHLPSLASILLQATVGMPRLLIPPDKMSLTFKTAVKKNIQDTVLVNNSGNITLHLSLGVTAFPACFSISPARLAIRPGGQEHVAVTFSPLESDVYRYQSLLLLDVEPEGPSYEIPMEAVVTPPACLRPAPLTILTSKSYLSFYGVPLNQTKSLTVRLYNKDSERAEHASVEVRQSSDCFKLVSSSGEWQQNCELVMGPKEKVSLTIIFCPTAVRGYSGKLVIRKQDSRSSKYSIPLSGYGGRSMLALSGACLTNSGQHWLELGPLSGGRNIMKEVVLTNSGVRAAFVRASAFFDMPCSQAVPPGRVAVEPNSFVLAPGCSRQVMVAASPSQREVDLVRDRKEVVAVVRFHHGDEVMRQKYQRACSREGHVDPHSWQGAFRQQFACEVQDSVVQEGRTIPDGPDDTTAFFHHLKSQCVALLGQPPPEHEGLSMSVSAMLQAAAPAEQASLSSRDRTPRQSREESQRLDSPGTFLIPTKPECDDRDWTVEPDLISLSGDNNHKTLRLINFSRQPLRFELSWPPSSVVPEPGKGELKPRSSCTIEVWLHVNWQQGLSELPWRGSIVICCNGQEKTVRVNIQKPTQLSVSGLSSPHTASPVSSSSVSARSARDTTLTSKGHSLHLASSSLHFPKARVNAVHESTLELTNMSTDPVHWKMSAFAPAYVKGADESNTVQRVGYNVFTISPTSADLLPQETMKVPVKFCPHTKGAFNQHWEIEYQVLTAGRVTAQDKLTTRISLTAEVSSQESTSSGKPTWDAVGHDKTGVGRSRSSSRTPLQEKHSNTTDVGPASSSPELQLVHPDVTFTNTQVGQVTQVKVEFKNSLDHNVSMEVDPPKPPFRIKHKSFKITKKRYLKYPIEFVPSAAGTFVDSMLFCAPELGKTFTVHLKGKGL